MMTDLTMGQPMEQAMRGCLLAAQLARSMGLSEKDLVGIYYTTLLKYLGCTAYAHEQALLFGGDDIAINTGAATVDFGNPRAALSFLLFGSTRGAPPWKRARIAAALLARGPALATEVRTSHCDVATNAARRLRLPAEVQQGLYQMYERWDGKGVPQKLAGEDVALAARYTHVACTAVIFERLGGAELAVDVIRSRSASEFDPSIAAAFARHGPALLAESHMVDLWEAVVEAEPQPPITALEPDVENVARAFADLVDLKSPFTRGHSPGVSRLAEGAACELRLAKHDTVSVRRAGLLHDLGRAGVSNGIWDKPGPLTTTEWEQVRLHPYHTERILARSPALSPLAPLAGMHHERQDGSGYHRQISGSAIPLAARLLAAADVYQAMTEKRPHRPALSGDQAADELRQEAKTGRLAPEPVDAVLAAAGHEPAPNARPWPAGLSDREVEVLRLVARGSSTREVATSLSISPKTADHHVQHIYNKIGVSTRAAAALFAMEHDLLPG